MTAAAREEPVRFGPGRSLVGVRTDPVEDAADGTRPAVLFLNSGLLHHVGPHRLHVNLARRLARAGHRSLRFDLSGIGDSGPRPDHLGRDESMVRETQDAMDLLGSSHDERRFVLFGICTGADQAVRVALADPRVVGAVLVDGYAYPTRSHFLHYYLGRLANPRSWWNVLTLRHPAFAAWGARLHGASSGSGRSSARSPEPGPGQGPAVARPGIYVRPPQALAESRLGSLADRDCRLCFVFTPSTNYSHAAQFGGMFPTLRHHRAIHVEFLRDANHVFTLLACQDALMTAVERWMAESFPRRGAAAGR